MGIKFCTEKKKTYELIDNYNRKHSHSKIVENTKNTLYFYKMPSEVGNKYKSTNIFFM